MGHLPHSHRCEVAHWRFLYCPPMCRILGTFTSLISSLPRFCHQEKVDMIVCHINIFHFMALWPTCDWKENQRTWPDWHALIVWVLTSCRWHGWLSESDWLSKSLPVVIDMVGVTVVVTSRTGNHILGMIVRIPLWGQLLFRSVTHCGVIFSGILEGNRLTWPAS